MRQALGSKKLRHYREVTGLDIVSGMVRGGTNHRVDLCTVDGVSWHLYRDGTLKRSNDQILTLAENRLASILAIASVTDIVAAVRE